MNAFALILVIVLAGLAILAVVAWTLSGGWLRNMLQRTRQRKVPAAKAGVPLVANARVAAPAQARRVVVPARAGQAARITSTEPDAQRSEEPTQPRAHWSTATAATTAIAALVAAAPEAPVADHFIERSGDDTSWPSTSWHSTSWPATQPSSMSSLSTQFADTLPMPLETTAAR